MLRNRFFQAGVAGVAVVAVQVILVRWLLGGGSIQPQAVLAAQALSEGIEEGEREVAAVQLARHPEEPAAELRRVLRESESPKVRAAVIRGLGNLYDVDSLPELIDAMEDESVLVRGRAGVAVQRIVGLDAGFRAEDPEEKRGEAVAKYRQFWEECQQPDSKFIEYMKDPSKAQKSAEEYHRRAKQAGEQNGEPKTPPRSESEEMDR